MEAVQIVQSRQKSQAQIARELGVADSTLSHWRKELSKETGQVFILSDIEGLHLYNVMRD